jgi:hypothetical protein
MTAEARAARVSAWGLLAVSGVAMGAALAADSPVTAAGMAVVALLTGWASAAERAHQHECEAV